VDVVLLSSPHCPSNALTKNQAALSWILPISAAWQILSSIKNASPVLPGELIILRVHFRALKTVFETSLLPRSMPSLLADNTCEDEHGILPFQAIHPGPAFENRQRRLAKVLIASVD
jgi:hypothetical protein